LKPVPKGKKNTVTKKAPVVEKKTVARVAGGKSKRQDSPAKVIAEPDENVGSPLYGPILSYSGYFKVDLKYC
jgi:hypothetical protein